VYVYCVKPPVSRKSALENRRRISDMDNFWLNLAGRMRKEKKENKKKTFVLNRAMAESFLAVYHRTGHRLIGGLGTHHTGRRTLNLSC
jgi:hypothetical protein